jgi:hypothetical protein
VWGRTKKLAKPNINSTVINAAERTEKDQRPTEVQQHYSYFNN